MEKKIEEKIKKLQQVIDSINKGRNQIAQLEQEGLMLQGELRVLKELEAEKEVEKEAETPDTE